MFPTDRSLTVGVFFPIEAYSGAVPTMRDQVQLARRADELGFTALWFRDVPLHDPTFGDVGQIFDPWVYLGHLAAQPMRAALVTGGIVLPLRHPLHVAKAATSVDVLSGGRMVLGLSSGDRPVEYPAFGLAHSARAKRFRDAVTVLDQIVDPFPVVRSPFGDLSGGVDLLPKPVVGRLPRLAVGRAGQDVDWLAEHFDAFVTYPRRRDEQDKVIRAWRDAVDRVAPGARKPVAQSLYIDLAPDPWTRPTPIHLGYRVGRWALLDHLIELADIGVEHVVLNLKYGRRHAADVIEEIGGHVLPALPGLKEGPA